MQGDSLHAATEGFSLALTVAAGLLVRCAGGRYPGLVLDGPIRERGQRPEQRVTERSEAVLDLSLTLETLDPADAERLSLATKQLLADLVARPHS